MTDTQKPAAAPQTNGNHGDYSSILKDSLLQEERIEHKTVEKLSDEHETVLRTFRVLIADLCAQFKGGHPGGAMGMAAIGVALWKYAMRYAPHSPDWFNRDRFVLSNGMWTLQPYSAAACLTCRDGAETGRYANQRHMKAIHACSSTAFSISLDTGT